MHLLIGKRRRRIARAERRLRDHPSPAAYLDLARAHVADGVDERALEVVKRGREAFPDAVDLAAFYDEICWSHVRQRARHLQARIDADPRPSDVVALARLFAQVGDLSRAIDTLKGGVEQFADDLRVHLEMARLRLRLWRRDLLSADGLEAVERLTCVIALDDQHVEALVSIAEVYAQAGAFEEALGCLERLASCRADALDEPTCQRLDRLAAVAQERMPHQTQHDLDTLLEVVEASGRPIVSLEALDADREPVAEGEGETETRDRRAVLQDRLLEEAGRLAGEPGMRAVVVHRQGAVPDTLGAVGPEAGDAVQAVLVEIAATASQACQRIQIGRLTAAGVASRGGTVAMVGLGDEVVACLCDSTWRPQQAETRLAAFAAAVAAPEGAEP